MLQANVVRQIVLFLVHSDNTGIRLYTDYEFRRPGQWFRQGAETDTDLKDNFVLSNFSQVYDSLGRMLMDKKILAQFLFRCQTFFFKKVAGTFKIHRYMSVQFMFSDSFCPQANEKTQGKVIADNRKRQAYDGTAGQNNG